MDFAGKQFLYISCWKPSQTVDENPKIEPSARWQSYVEGFSGTVLARQEERKEMIWVARQPTTLASYRTAVEPFAEWYSCNGLR